MAIHWLIASILASLMLVACDETQPYKPPVPHTEKETGPVLFPDQIKALEKAKGVEQTVEKQSQEQQKAIDQASH